jgi:hypothetical protein
LPAPTERSLPLLQMIYKFGEGFGKLRQGYEAVRMFGE